LGINTAPQKGSVDLLGFIIIAIAIFAVWKFMTKPKREK
jgi:large-conductance mechanosensitive channel